MSKLWQEEAQDEEMMIMEMERDMEKDKLYVGLEAAKDELRSTAKIAEHIEMVFGKNGAQNIARAILGKTLYAEWK